MEKLEKQHSFYIEKSENWTKKKYGKVGKTKWKLYRKVGKTAL